MIKGFLIGFFCFIVFLILHIVIFHNWKIKRRFEVLARILCGLLPVYVLLYILIPTEAMIIMPVDPRVTPGGVKIGEGR